jgi:hypothetical protein
MAKPCQALLAGQVTATFLDAPVVLRHTHISSSAGRVGYAYEFTRVKVPIAEVTLVMEFVLVLRDWSRRITQWPIPVLLPRI